MKLIILEGMPATGKTVLGTMITDLLKSRLDKDKYEVFFIKDNLNPFDISILKLVQEKENELEIEEVKQYFKEIVKKLHEIEKASKKQCIFVVHRFYLTYLPFLKLKDATHFKEIENMISNYTFHITLNYNYYHPDTIYDRLKRFLELKDENDRHRFYFRQIVFDPSKGDTQKERLFNHYLIRYNIYKKSFDELEISNKKLIHIDKVINAEDYDSTLIQINEDIVDFVMR